MVTLSVLFLRQDMPKGGRIGGYGSIIAGLVWVVYLMGCFQSLKEPEIVSDPRLMVHLNYFLDSRKIFIILYQLTLLNSMAYTLLICVSWVSLQMFNASHPESLFDDSEVESIVSSMGWLWGPFLAMVCEYWLNAVNLMRRQFYPFTMMLALSIFTSELLFKNLARSEDKFLEVEDDLGKIKLQIPLLPLVNMVFSMVVFESLYPLTIYKMKVFGHPFDRVFIHFESLRRIAQRVRQRRVDSHELEFYRLCKK
jgi:hypothetical protein